ncbi:MAG TPA: mandelate racemase/muconate lactonizing enzyme family protein [Solirubrobacterales bacterium]|jgi:o-succinylbenzoate synthase|nr:mandelate racemase/muconate lactonizing enzyme family protein [Solirubrobacterales bacterium]
MKVEVVPYALPFKEPYVTARGRLTRREMVLLRITDEDGLEGLGEAVPLSLRGGVTIEKVVRELEGLGSTAEEIPASLSLPARCALSTALLDLGEKRVDTKAEHVPVRCNATLVSGPPGEVAAEAARWAKAGFGTFKLKVGAGEDVAQVEAVRAAVGPEAKIRLDANASWSLEEATRILAAVEPLGIELVEQPVETTAEATELAWRTRIPLAGDESIVTVADAEESVRENGFGITGVKLSKVGGIEAGREIAGVMRTYVASALDGPVGIAIGRRLAESVDSTAPAEERLAHGLATRRLFRETIAAEECALEGDLLHEAPGPGLGVVIDEDSLRHHRL